MNKIILALFLMSTIVTAYDNASMSEEYRHLIYNDPFHAVMNYYEGGLGPWFYLALLIAPYLGIIIYTGGNMTLGTMWMFSVLAAYGWKLEGVPQYVFYLAFALWVTSVLVKTLSPKYTN